MRKPKSKALEQFSPEGSIPKGPRVRWFVWSADVPSSAGKGNDAERATEMYQADLDRLIERLGVAGWERADWPIQCIVSYRADEPGILSATWRLPMVRSANGS